MKAIILMFDSLNRHALPAYRGTMVDAPNFARLASSAATFENFYAGSMPCMPARREMHTGRYNFLHRSWGPLEPFDDSMPQMLRDAGIHTHLVSDHPHYWEDGGGTFHTRYTTWECFRGQEGDPWKGVVSAGVAGADFKTAIRGQDAVNRTYMPTTAEHTQTRTVDAGLHFLDVNAADDDWMLQIELFDPHEPFFTHDDYRSRHLDAEQMSAERFDWPGYQKVTEPEDQAERARREYASLVSMCDDTLGRVLDAMDAHDLWKDTLLIVNTDHGFLLGEHGWWAKSVQPWFNELVHLPMFLWDPRTGGADTRRGDLAQTIDIAPTMLRHFGLEPTEDMQGRDLAVVGPDAGDGARQSDGDGAGDDAGAGRGADAGREAALFGVHGGHVNITDGRYVYMRSSVSAENQPLEEFTLMPTHMRSRFAPAELTDWEPVEPFSFTKQVRTMRIPTAAGWLNSWRHGTLLYDLEADPRQEHPLQDDELELRMARMLVDTLRASEAPRSQFERLGLPADGEVTVEHLLVAEHAERAAAVAEPLPPAEALPDVVARRPLPELLAVPEGARAVEAWAPDLVRTETVNVPGGVTLLDLAAFGAVTAAQLRGIAEALVDRSVGESLGQLQ
ncbi:sulfatase [Nesterenkonia halophila]|uniref:sulfatase n=1 Tax=Nesterenkonia halophila TaxID=302044 RepID=UPI001291B4DA|nr:sulfatase [Nesterenkonia halophila]